MSLRKCKPPTWDPVALNFALPPVKSSTDVRVTNLGDNGCGRKLYDVKMNKEKIAGEN